MSSMWEMLFMGTILSLLMILAMCNIRIECGCLNMHSLNTQSYLNCIIHDLLFIMVVPRCTKNPSILFNGSKWRIISHISFWGTWLITRWRWSTRDLVGHYYLLRFQSENEKRWLQILWMCLSKMRMRHDAIWVIVDRLTKSVYFLAIGAKLFLQNLINIYSRSCQTSWGS